MINNYPLIFRNKVLAYYFNNKNVKVKEILTIFGISNGTLYNWANLYRSNNLHEKLPYKKNTKYTINIQKYICKYVKSKCNFSYKLLIMNIKRVFKITCSKSKIYDILKKNNMSRKRIKIKTIIGKKNNLKQKINKFKRKINKLNFNDIISIDETSIDTHIHAYYGWSERGYRINAIKNKGRVRYSVISAISNNKIIHNKLILGSANGEDFKEFVKDVNIKIGNIKKYMLMDNARIHHSKIVKEYVNTINHEIIYNVPYCSEFNPIEMVFSKVKSVLHKKNNIKKEELKKNILKAFNKISKSNLNNYYAKALTFE